MKKKCLCPKRLLAASLAFILGLLLSPFFLRAAGQEKRLRTLSRKADAPLVIDGNLEDWKKEGLLKESNWIVLSGKDQLPQYEENLNRDWKGSEDLSGMFWFAYDTIYFYIAGQIYDDHLEHKETHQWWNGDCVELFFDIDLDEDRKVNEYSGDDYQIFLMPLNEEVKWGVANLGGKLVMNDGGFDGVLVAHTHFAGGYALEAAIPLGNFLKLSLMLLERADLDIGFNLAINDADGSPGKERHSYMTWNGKKLLYKQPQNFEILTFQGKLEKETEEASFLEFGKTYIFIALPLLLALILVFLTQRWLQSWLSRKPGWIAFLIGGAFVLLMTSLFLPGVWERVHVWKEKKRFQERLQILSGLIEEGEASGLLAWPGKGRENFLSLLSGEAVPLRQEFNYRFLPLQPSPGTLKTIEMETPFLVCEKGFEVSGEARYQFPTLGTEKADAIHFLYGSLRRIPPPAGMGETTERGRAELKGEIGSILTRFKNGEEISLPLVPGKTVDESVSTSLWPHEGSHDPALHWALRRELEQSPNATSGEKSPPSQRWFQHSFEYILQVPGRLRDVPIESFELSFSSDSHTFFLEGITLSQKAPVEKFLPLPLRRKTLTNVPVEAWERMPLSLSISLKSGQKSIPVGQRASKLWILYTSFNGFPDPLGSPFGTRIGSLTVQSLDGKKEQIDWINGRNIDNHLLRYPGRHSKRMESAVALRWAQGEGQVAHFDIIEVDLGEEVEIQEILVEKRITPEILVVAGITLGVPIPWDFPRNARSYLLAGKQTFRIQDEIRASLKGLAFSLGGYFSQAPSPDKKWIITESRNTLESHLPLSREGGIATFLTVKQPVLVQQWLSTLRRAVSTFAYFPGFILCLLLLTLFLERIRRLRFKLIFGFGVASFVPLILLFIFLNSIVRNNIEEKLRSNSSSYLKVVKRNLEILKNRIQNQARIIVEDPRLQEELELGEPGEEGRRDIEERLTELKEALFKENLSTFIVLQDHRLTEKEPGWSRHTYFSSPFIDKSFYLNLFTEFSEDDLYCGWGKMAIFVSEPFPIKERRWQNLVVGYPVDKGIIQDLAKGVSPGEVFIYSSRGYPYFGTLDLPVDKSGSRIRHHREIIGEIERTGEPFFRVQSAGEHEYSTFYDLIQNRERETVALLAVASPRKSVQIMQEQITRIFLILGFAILLLIVITGSFLTRRITTPIEKLQKMAQQVRAGNLDAFVEVAGGDEIERLMDSFNRMTLQLKTRIGELSTLNQGLKDLTTRVDIEGIIEQAMRLFSGAVSPSGVAFILFHKDKNLLEIKEGFFKDKVFREISYPRTPGVTDTVLNREECLVLENLRKDDLFLSSPPQERELAGDSNGLASFPLLHSGGAVGVIHLYFDHFTGQVSEKNIDFLSTLAREVAIAIEHSNLYRLAIVDPETGLYVHRYFEVQLAKEIERANKFDRSLSLIMVEIDQAREVAARYGPDEAKFLFREVAKTFKKILRKIDLMARRSQERFEILLPETGKEEALRIAEKMREAMHKSVFSLVRDPSRTLNLSLSLGVAAFPTDARGLESFLEEAEMVLQKARKEGKDIVRSVKKEEERRAVEFEGILGSKVVFKSPKTFELLDMVERVARSGVSVLLQGETGAGKEVFAEIIHKKSDRSEFPLIKVNCSALPETLLESELFGHEKGAFSGAISIKLGRFELANKGSIFLDEVGDIPLPTQVKLLRVLQDKKFERLGGTQTLEVDVRIMAATNRDLIQAVHAGHFRKDLYYRLNVISLYVPPLRERKEEIPFLVESFIEDFNQKHNGKIKGITPNAMDYLMSFQWPGNVRQLKNCLDRAMVLTTGIIVEKESILPDFNEETLESREHQSKNPLPEGEPGLKSMERVSGLNERQIDLLELLKTRKAVTSQEYMEVMKISIRTAKRDLAELVSKGILQRHGKTKGAVYRLSGRFHKYDDV